MDAAARVGGSDAVAGRGDLIRGGRGREGGALERRTALESLSSEEGTMFYNCGENGFIHNIFRGGAWQETRR
jgi:hypothetical protein